VLSGNGVNLQASGGKLAPTENGVEIIIIGVALFVMFRRARFEENEATRKGRRLIVACGLNPRAATL
jgi:hypothetical protein